jgi:hypothetical protein
MAARHRSYSSCSYPEGHPQGCIPIPGDLARGARSPEEIKESEALDRLADARCVVVADDHSIPTIAERTGRVIEQVATRWPSGTAVALFCEHLPSSTQEHLDAALAAAATGNEAELRAMLSPYLSFPLRGYVALLTTVARLGIRVIAVAPPAPARVVIPLDVPDEERAFRNPRARWIGPTPSGSTEGRTLASNRLLVESVERFLDGRMGKSRAWVLFGQAHVFGEEGIVAMARARGWTTGVLLPVAPEIEEALWSRGGWTALRRWHSLEEGVLRSPSVAESEYDYMVRIAKIQDQVRWR